jgi:hypothetical protein
VLTGTKQRLKRLVPSKKDTNQHRKMATDEFRPRQDANAKSNEPARTKTAQYQAQK